MKSAIPLSRSLTGPVFAEPLRHHSAEKSSPSLSSSSIPPPLPECSNCKQERKIREEYDKFIIQVKRDRDILSQRVTELEKELKNRGEQRENGSPEKDKRRAERDFGRQEIATGSNETENKQKTEGEVSQIIRERGERKDKTEKEGKDNRKQSRETALKEGEWEEERKRKEEQEGGKGNDSTGKESISASYGGTEVPKNTEVNSQEFSQLKEVMFYQPS